MLFNFTCLVPGGCPAYCPALCPTEQTCSYGSSNGCPLRDFCMPNSYGNDGNKCPLVCPTSCSSDPDVHMWCDGGFDDNGCKLPDECVSPGMCL